MLLGYEGRIAWRYLRARRKQVVVSVVTIISVLGVVVGSAALVIALALLTGFQEDVRGRILAANAHLFLYRDYVGKPWHGWEEVHGWVSSRPGVASVSPLVLEKGLMTSRYNPDGAAVLLRGVDPGVVGAAAAVPGTLDGGSLEELAEEPRGIFLGRDLAASLGVARGGEVRVLTSRPTLTPFGAAPTVRRFAVLGTFETGFFEYDSGWALLSLRTAQELFGEANAVSAIQVQVEDLDGVESMAASVRERFPGEVGTLTWMEMNRPLFSAFKLEKLLMFLSIGLIVVVGALNIAALLVMSVMEKTRDIGILRAMGATTGSIKKLFVIQGVTIGVLGTFLGCLIGFSVAWSFDAWEVIRLDPHVYFIDHLPFRVRPLEFALVASMAVVVTFAATLYPAWKAARLDPAEALRFE